MLKKRSINRRLYKTSFVERVACRLDKPYIRHSTHIECFRVSGRFELSKVRVTEVNIPVNVCMRSRRNEFGSSWREFRLSESLSYHESLTVITYSSGRQMEKQVQLLVRREVEQFPPDL